MVGQREEAVDQRVSRGRVVIATVPLEHPAIVVLTAAPANVGNSVIGYGRVRHAFSWRQVTWDLSRRQPREPPRLANRLRCAATSTCARSPVAPRRRVNRTSSPSGSTPFWV